MNIEELLQSFSARSMTDYEKQQYEKIDFSILYIRSGLTSTAKTVRFHTHFLYSDQVKIKDRSLGQE